MRLDFKDFRKLSYFVVVAQELHFGRAAARLGISQPPLTEHMKDLEARLGTQLFNRSMRKISLTAAGSTLLREAQRLLGQADEMSHLMEGVANGKRGHLTLGCVPSALYEYLPAIARRFRDRHPNITVTVREAHSMSISDGVLAGEIDAGLLWGSHFHEPIGSMPLDEGNFLVAVPSDHKLARLGSVKVADLVNEPMVVTPRYASNHHHDMILSGFRKENLSANIKYEIPTILSQLGFIASGMAVGLMLPFARRLAGDDLVFLEIDDNPFRYTLSFIHNLNIPSTAVDCFRKTLPC